MSEELEDGVADELNEFLSQHGGGGRGEVEEDEEEAPEEAEDERAAAEPSTQQVKSRQLIATRVGELAQMLNLSVAKEVLLGVSELVRRYTEVMAKDLDAFSDHAKRKTIAPPDVLLCARRNPALHEVLRGMCDAEAPPKRRKKAAPAPAAAEAAPEADPELNLEDD